MRPKRHLPIASEEVIDDTRRMTLLPQRRSIRLHAYDYSTSGVYFVTVCTHERQQLFGRVVDGMEVIQRITSAPMSSTSEAQTGSGRPQNAIKILSVTVVE